MLNRNADAPAEFETITVGSDAVIVFFTAVHTGEKRPPWSDPMACPEQHWTVFVSLDQGAEWVSFDFFQSSYATQKGEAPSAGDVIEMISSDAAGPTEPDEVYAEFGEMKPSRATVIAEWAAELQEWLGGCEVEPEQLHTYES